MIDLNDRFNQSFAKVRVSLTSATLPSYFFVPLFAFLSIGYPILYETSSSFHKLPFVPLEKRKI